MPSDRRHPRLCRALPGGAAGVTMSSAPLLFSRACRCRAASPSRAVARHRLSRAAAGRRAGRAGSPARLLGCRPLPACPSLAAAMLALGAAAIVTGCLHETARRLRRRARAGAIVRSPSQSCATAASAASGSRPDSRHGLKASALASLRHRRECLRSSPRMPARAAPRLVAYGFMPGARRRLGAALGASMTGSSRSACDRLLLPILVAGPGGRLAGAAHRRHRRADRAPAGRRADRRSTAMCSGAEQLRSRHAARFCGW